MEHGNSVRTEFARPGTAIADTIHDALAGSVIAR